MRQNATLARRDELDPAQLTAVESLLAGKTVTEAATSAGVCRQTVHRWLKEDSVFVAELNRVRREQYQALRARLEHLAGKALDAVGVALEAGDVRVALIILRGLGMLPDKPPHIGSDEPARIDAEWTRERLFQPYV